MDVFEHAKENIVPLTQGRSAKTLARLYGGGGDGDPRTGERSSGGATVHPAQQAQPRTAPPAATSSVDAQLRALEAEVAAVTEDDADPLDAHDRLLRLYEAHFTSGQHARGYKVALERAARTFRKDPRYKNDLRFVKVWLRVARSGKVPEDVFKYLSVNEIGTQTALFYEEYAELLESLGRFKEAEEVYDRGVRRKAAPLERLARKHAAFQKRMATGRRAALEAEDDYSTKPPQQQPPPLPASMPPAAPTELRRPLRPSADSGAARGVPASVPTDRGGARAGKLEVYRDAPGEAAAARAGAVLPGKLEVYRDAPGEAAAARAGAVLPSAATAGMWDDYGTERGRAKENATEPGRWAGETLPQRVSSGVGGRGAAAGQARVTVYQDEVIDEEPLKRPAPRSILKPSAPLGAHSFTEELSRADNAAVDARLESGRNFGLMSSAASTKPAHSSPRRLEGPNLSQNTNSAVARNETATGIPEIPWNERFVCDLEAIYTEQSPIRTRDVHSSIPVPIVDETSPFMCPKPAAIQVQELERDSRPMKSLQSTPTPAMAAPPKMSEHQYEQLPMPKQISDLPPVSEIKSRNQQPSPTINTKAALADVFEMFNAPLPSEEADDEDDDSDALLARGSRAVQPDVAPSTESGDVAAQPPSWLDVETDETISSKVFRPQIESIKGGVFRDADDAVAVNARPADTKAQTTTKARRPLGAKPVETTKPAQIAPAAPDYENAAQPPDEVALGWQAAPRTGVAPPRAPVAGFVLPDLNRAIDSTPDVRKFQFEDEEAEDEDDEHLENLRLQSLHLQRARADAAPDVPISSFLRSGLGGSGGMRVNQPSTGGGLAAAHGQDALMRAMMTPIAEASFEVPSAILGDRTVASLALSTVSTAKFSQGLARAAAAAAMRGASIGDFDVPDGVHAREHSGGFGALDAMAGGGGARESLLAYLKEPTDSSGSGVTTSSAFEESTLSSISRTTTLSLASFEPTSLSSVPGGAGLSEASLEPSKSFTLPIFPQPPEEEEAEPVDDEDDDNDNDNDDDEVVEEVMPENPTQLSDPRLRDYAMKNSEFPLEMMAGYVDCSKINDTSPSTAEGGLEVAIDASLEAKRLCQFRVGNLACVRFNVVADLVAAGKDTGKLKAYLVKEPRNGFVAPASYFGQEDEDDDESDDDDDDDEEDEEDGDGKTRQSRYSVMKLDNGRRGAWEFFAVSSLCARLPAAHQRLVPHPVSCHRLPGSLTCTRFSVGQFGAGGLPATLQDAVRAAATGAYAGPAATGGVEELLAAFWCAELMRAVEAVHAAGLAHLAVGPRCVLLRFGRGAWANKYDPAGAGGWAARGVRLAGFESSLDLVGLPQAQAAAAGGAESHACSAHCSGSQQEEGRCCCCCPAGARAGADSQAAVVEPDAAAAAYAADWRAVACTASVLLAGVPIETEVLADGAGGSTRYRWANAPWCHGGSSAGSWRAADVWERIMDALLNPSGVDSSAEQASSAPAVDGGVWSGAEYVEKFEELVAEFPGAVRVRRARTELEAWLAEASAAGGRAAGRGLKPLLQRVDLATA
ncbi:hypothetical protein HK405_003170 [Cladochytrium tenue]|nr:hypothetical protein HK405_003170 [Cladochytrium tenue]